MDAARFLKSSFLRVLVSDTELGAVAEPAKASALEAAELESMAANLKGALRYKTPKF